MQRLFARFIREDRGQDLIEYACLAAFVGLAAVIGLQAVAIGMKAGFGSISVKLS